LNVLFQVVTLRAVIFFIVKRDAEIMSAKGAIQFGMMQFVIIAALAENAVFNAGIAEIIAQIAPIVARVAVVQMTPFYAAIA